MSLLTLYIEDSQKIQRSILTLLIDVDNQC